MSREFSHPGDDATFVRRCRIVAVAAMRLGAIYLAWRALAGLLSTIMSMAQYGTLAGGPPVTFLTALLIAAPVVSGFVLWISAGWLAARLLPMPPSRSQCPKCKYPIGDLDADTCPECGARVR